MKYHPDIENSSNNVSKRNKASGNKGNEHFKCDTCNVKFGQKTDLNKHVATVHEGKKQFK